jgi:hypothetical protein
MHGIDRMKKNISGAGGLEDCFVREAYSKARISLEVFIGAS